MAYVPATGQVVLFGGVTDQQETHKLGDTWTWDGSNWTHRQVSPAPTKRYDTAMATDPSGGAVLFSGFGTCAVGGNGTYCPDTWVWSGRSWTRRRPPTSPPADVGHAMAYDPATRTVLKYSGEEFNGCCGSTWEWNGHTWTEQHPATLPLRQPHGGFAYDSIRKTLIMFAGSPPATDFTWEWNGTDWTRRIPAVLPHRRDYPALATNPGGGVVLFGGGSNHRPYFPDTWTSN